MPLSPPPMSLVWKMEQLAPGVLHEFVRRINAAAGPRTTGQSWWRSPTENRRVRGSPDSQHLVATGVDLWDPNLSALEARLRAQGLIAVRLQGDFGPYTHVQAWPAGVARGSGLLRALGL